MEVDSTLQEATPSQAATTPSAGKRYLFEFLSMFFAVILAFALNSWNDNRKMRNTELEILKEISNGLALDANDVKDNMSGHKSALKSAAYMKKLLLGEQVDPDSIAFHKRNLLRDYISIQNISGYESLKSQGLGIIESDSLRLEIISVYEYHFELIEKLEEHYAAGQFLSLYGDRLNDALSPYFVFDTSGSLETINLPVNLSEKDRNRILLDLNAIEAERNFVYRFYTQVGKQIEKTKALVDASLSN